MVKGLYTQTKGTFSPVPKGLYGKSLGSMRSISHSSFLQDLPAYPTEGALEDAELLIPQATEQTSSSIAVCHASPVAPLREQDAQALDMFFDSEQIQEIVMDVHRYIAGVYPEPCWEDEPYDFLHGFI